ncbi:toll-like receptor Tollo [Mya arenaria]|uniref:toll-like receptor Tollo n=1 Tax=Mya arenaria TaxID=6604 RepID=UPI0022E3652E|nr:toll-like receptor Tollo [Mya arenaria]
MSQNDEMQERSPSDDSQQGYQSPNAVTSNTDRQLNGKIRLRPNDEMVRSSSGDECDDGQLGYQSLVVLQPHPDIHQSDQILNGMRLSITVSLHHNRISEIIGHFSLLPDLETIILHNNKLKGINSATFSNNSHLRELDLSYNEISHIDEHSFNNLKSLLYLKLESNKLSSLPRHLFNDLGNQLACNCSNKNLQNWLNVDSGLRVLNYMCVNGDGTMGDFLTKELDCKTPSEHVDIKSAVISIALILAVVFVSSAIVFYKRHEIHVIAFYKFHIRLKCWCKYRRKDYTNYKYDAFISFVDHDMSFVRNDLLTLLEPQYSVCIYYRDFPVGEDIAEAILKAIKTSAVTLVVLSKEYLASRWGMFEFREAHHAAMLNDNHRVIVVIPDRDVLHMKLDLTLRSILYCKAYLETADILFKEKLLHIMPEQSVNSIEEADQEDAIETDLISV